MTFAINVKLRCTGGGGLPMDGCQLYYEHPRHAKLQYPGKDRTDED